MQALETFIEATLAITENQELAAPFDPEWRSPCEIHQDTEFTYWRPKAQDEPVNFAGLENALECEIHPDIKAFYGSYWSGTLEADSEEGRVSLIQLWNPEDFDRLIANLIGHSMAKQRIKQPFTVFIANTDPESELFLSIDNATGAVMLEEPGRAPIREVESDVASFLGRLSPKIRPPELY